MNNSTNDIRIDLIFSQSSSVASGRPDGKECYQTQVRSKIESHLNMCSGKIIMAFPKHIKLISGSFLLGLFEEICNIMGIEGIKRTFKFESHTGDDLLQLLLDELKRSAY